MAYLEMAAAVLGVVNVVLIVRRSLWNYPFGLAMVTLYAVVFFDARLYADSLLQVYFFGVQLYGWWVWTHGRGDDGRILVEWLSWRDRALVAVATGVAVLTVGLGMAAFTNAAAPWWDAAVAGLSVAAQFLLARRKIENWVLWIVVDILAIGLFWSRGLTATAALYAVFLCLASYGLASWYLAFKSAREGSLRSALT